MALPARSYGVVEGVQVIVPVAVSVSVDPLAVPSVTVIVEPLLTIVEGVPVTPNVLFVPT